MSIVEKLDLAIKLKETGTDRDYYTVPYKSTVLKKRTYMTNNEWVKFLQAMPQTAHKEYADGDGGELKEKNGRPPKMASYGSSSRMIYTLSKKIPNFHFEKKLPTSVGGKANLDGFYEDGKHSVFVEAKCHEPYSLKKNVISQCYKGVYEYINAAMKDKICIDMKPSAKEGYMDVVFIARNDVNKAYETIERLDLKQMICHLLGIATGLLNGTVANKPIDFIYLLYDPTDLAIETNAKKKIDAIYAKTCKESDQIDFRELFGVIFDFLRKTKFPTAVSDQVAAQLVSNFTFTLRSQNNYKI